MRGGLEALGRDYIRIESLGFMRLVIEAIGPNTVSVAHYGEQNGDAMRDPEITFRVTPFVDKPWHFEPLTYLNDYLGIFQEDLPESRTQTEHVLKFCKLWDRNIEEQGFVEAFRKMLEQPVAETEVA